MHRHLFLLIDPATTEISTFPYTTLFRSRHEQRQLLDGQHERHDQRLRAASHHDAACRRDHRRRARHATRSEEHTSELQSHSDLVCRLLLEKKKEIELTTSLPNDKLSATL